MHRCYPCCYGEGYEYYLQGNIIKYLWRYRYKNGVEDLEKAQWYLTKLIEERNVDNMLPTPYQQFIHKSRYARWIDNEQRRENWDETVYRYTNFMRNHLEEQT